MSNREYYKYPDVGHRSYKASVDSYADLPDIANKGDIRLVVTESKLYRYSGSMWELLSGANNLYELDDVNVTLPATQGDKLYYNGTEWVNAKDAVVLTVRQTGLCDFNTISAALASITDNSIIKQYIIDIAGTFAEDITLLPFVHLRGQIGLAFSSPVLIIGKLSGTGLRTAISNVNFQTDVSSDGEIVHEFSGSISFTNSIIIGIIQPETDYNTTLMKVTPTLSSDIVLFDTCSLQISSAFVNSTKDITFIETTSSNGALVWTDSSTRLLTAHIDSGDVTFMKLANKGEVATRSHLITWNNSVAFSGSAIGTYDLSVGSIAERNHQSPQFRMEVQAGSTGSATMFKNESGRTIDTYNANHQIEGFANAYSQDTLFPAVSISRNASTNIVLTPIGDGSNFVTPYMDEKSGFISWTGSGDYWSITGDELTILRGGIGAIRSNISQWYGNQTVTLTHYATNFIYANDKGIIGVTTTPNTTFYLNGTPLLEVYFNGTEAIVTKENHPYSVDTEISRYLHEVNGSLITGEGANVTVASPYVSVLGDAVLRDHGLDTVLPSTLGANLIWNVYYKDSSGRWTKHEETSTLTALYNNAGFTPTLVPANNYTVYRLYATKDNLNSSAPVYIAVMSTINVTNQNQADTAVAKKIPQQIDGALAYIEPVQLGYVSVRNAATTITKAYIEKQIAGATLFGGTPSNNATSIIVDTATFDKVLDGTITTAQALAEAVDELTHNKLNTKQGGTTDEYYHLTATQHSDLTNQSAQLKSTGNPTFNNLTVSGQLTVNSGYFEVTATKVSTQDNLIVLNDGEVGDGVTVGTSGIRVYRGPNPLYPAFDFVFDEDDNRFKVGQVGSLQTVATRDDGDIVDGSALKWDAPNNKITAANVISGDFADTTGTQTLTNKTVSESVIDVKTDIQPVVISFNNTTDWVVDGDSYVFSVNFETAVTDNRAIGTSFLVKDSTNQTIQCVWKVDGNTLYLRVAKDPDCKFSGTVRII